MILEKLDFWAPYLSEPYRQRQQRQVYLQQLRNQAHSLLDTRKENHYATYRRFDVGIALLGQLTANANYAEEGIRFAHKLYERTLYWRDIKLEAKVTRLWRLASAKCGKIS